MHSYWVHSYICIQAKTDLKIRRYGNLSDCRYYIFRGKLDMVANPFKSRSEVLVFRGKVTLGGGSKYSPNLLLHNVCVQL